jgi:hypothetical protein
MILGFIFAVGWALFDTTPARFCWWAGTLLLALVFWERNKTR